MEAIEIGKIIGGVIIGCITAYKVLWGDKKKHKEITENQMLRNKLALEQTIRLDALQDSIDMSNGFKSEDRVADIKHEAYGSQKLYFIREIISLYGRNNIMKRELCIENIKVVISKTISITDKFLSKTIPETFLYSTQKKIEYVNNHGTPESIYDIFHEAKMNEDNCDLFGRIGSVYDHALGQIKKEFYQDDGRVRDDI